jgi:hypothetical protein
MRRNWVNWQRRTRTLVVVLSWKALATLAVLHGSVNFGPSKHATIFSASLCFSVSISGYCLVLYPVATPQWNGFMSMFINVLVPLQYASARCEDVKSFVDDLSLGQGVVLSRAASTLRSIETCFMLKVASLWVIGDTLENNTCHNNFNF